MNTTLKRISKIVEGNGQPGLDKQMTQLNTIIPPLQKSVEDLTEKVQLLLDKDIAAATERTLKMSAKQKLAAIITTVIAFAGVALFAIDMMINK